MARKVTKLQDADERFVRVIVGLHKLTQWAREAGITERDLIREARRQRKGSKVMEMEKTEKFYNLTEVARILRVSPITVRRWVEEKKLRAFHPPGTRLYRIPETALREFVGPERLMRERRKAVKRSS